MPPYILLQDPPAMSHAAQIGVTFDNMYRTILIISELGYVPDTPAVDNKTMYVLLRKEIT